MKTLSNKTLAKQGLPKSEYSQQFLRDYVSKELSSRGYLLTDPVLPIIIRRISLNLDLKPFYQSKTGIQNWTGEALIDYAIKKENQNWAEQKAIIEAEDNYSDCSTEETQEQQSRLEKII